MSVNSRYNSSFNHTATKTTEKPKNDASNGWTIVRRRSRNSRQNHIDYKVKQTWIR